MTNFQQTSYPHIYRPKWMIYLINISVLTFMTIFAFGYFKMGVLPYFHLINAEAQPDFMMSASAIILFPIVLASFITYLILAVMLIAGLFSTLRIDDQGLEYHLWPQLHIRCNWPDVYLITKHLGISEVLQINDFEKVGLSISMGKLGSMFRMEKISIPLSKFNGWKTGALAKDLRQFAPQLFTEEYIIQAKQTKEELQTSNERFLSAICHASFYLGLMGIILPIILWFEQKGKSTYVRFQAIQAVIWQVVVHIFMILFLIILTIGLSVVVVMGTLYQQETWMQTLTIIGMGVLSLLTLAFLVLLLVGLLYPTVAILQTAQGKDFQYTWVGGWVKREK